MFIRDFMTSRPTWMLVYAFSAGTYFSSHHYAAYRVRGSSMAPCLNPDYRDTGRTDWVLVRKNVSFITDYKSEGGTGRKSALDRGTVVYFRSPVTGVLAVKRIVAVSQDVVKPLARTGEAPRGFEKFEPQHEVIVPFGHVWVEGDQIERAKNMDSNDYGPVSISLVEGVVVGIVKPWARIGPVGTDGDWTHKCYGRVKRSDDQDEVPEDWQLV